MIPKYVDEFSNELQFNVIRSLNRKGSVNKKGKLTISKQVERYIGKKYQITKKMQKSNILDKLKLNQRIVKDYSDQNESLVSDFKIRIGRHRQIKYTTPCGLTHSQTANSFIYWEFSRLIQMAEEKNEEISSNWQKLHDIRILKLSENLKKCK